MFSSSFTSTLNATPQQQQQQQQQSFFSNKESPTSGFSSGNKQGQTSFGAFQHSEFKFGGQPTLGGSPVFGGSPQQSTFGGAPVFGGLSQPTFGSAPTFGGFGGGFGSSPPQNQPTFGSG